MSRMGVGAELKVRLYMEGYHMKDALLNVRVTGAIGGPGTAQISIVPTNIAKHIMPGTWVHVFAIDPWEAAPAGDLSDFRLLFEGVVVGRGFTKEQGGRHLVLQCADPSIYWVNTRQFWLNFSQSGGGMVNQLQLATSGGRGTFVSLTNRPTHAYFLSKLAQVTDFGEDRFLETMISSIDDVGNVNSFYNNQRNRFRITDRLLHAPAGKTDQLFKMSLMTDFLNGIVGRKSGQTNLAQMVNLLLAPILHEWVSVPAPPYIEDAKIFSRDAFGNVRKIPVKIRVKGTESTVTSFEFARDTILGTTIFKPQVYTISPPTCNVLFPNMFDHMSYSENFLTETTRVSMNPQFPVHKQRDLLSAIHLLRPVELEIFSALARDSPKRQEDGKFGDGGGQAATLNETDWVTNEERIRGINYNFINLPPGAAELTIGGQGVQAPAGTGGGVVKYLQNVVSYEFYKSKYQSRTSSFTGPFNMRPVPGFPLLTLDDSDANMSMVSYLNSLTHSVDAKGVGQTTYEVKYPNLLDAVDWSRPIFENESDERTDTKRIATDETGQFKFRRLWDGLHRPPIPGWFGESWRDVSGLNDTYKNLFGVNPEVGSVGERPVRCVDSIMYDKASGKVVEILRGSRYAPSNEILEQIDTAIKNGIFSSESGDIALLDVANFLNIKYAEARNNGREFEEAARFTARPLAKIDQAFRFVGATPIETSTHNRLKKGATNAKGEKFDYTPGNMEIFVGDERSGSGYSGVPIQKGETSKSRLGQMSGVFPVFDSKIHTETVTKELRKKESGPSGFPRYDGRRVMFDFEKRFFDDSKKKAGVAGRLHTDEEIKEDGFPFDSKLGTSREDQKAQYDAQRKALDDEVQKVTSHSPEQQAPTGATLNKVEKFPLPEPLSENQVVELRRRVVKAYREELREKRGFTG